MNRRSLVLPLVAIAVSSCGEEQYTLGNVFDGGGAKLNHTFGQLIADGNSTKIAHYVEVAFSNANQDVMTPASGVVSFKASLDGQLNDCLLVKPGSKITQSASESDLAGPEPSLPDLYEIRFALCNIKNDNDDIKTSVSAFFESKGYTTDVDPDDANGRTHRQIATEGFMTGDPNFYEIEVTLDTQDPTNWTVLGKTAAGKLRVAAYQLKNALGNDEDGNRTYINPLPYIKDALPDPIFHAQAPQIVDAYFEISPAANMSNSVQLNFDSTTWSLQSSNGIDGFVKLAIKLDSRPETDANGPTVAPYAVTYSLKKTGSTDILSHGDARMHSIDVANVSNVLLHKSITAPSVVQSNDLWYFLVWDLASNVVASNKPNILDASASSESNILNLSAAVNTGQVLSDGAYELELEVRDVFSEPGDGHVINLTFLLKGPRLEFVKDTGGTDVDGDGVADGDHNIDLTDPIITTADIGHWGYDLGDGLSGYDLPGNTVKNGSNTSDNFVDLDKDRFYLRVIDDDANTNSSVAEKVTASISTLRFDQSTVDDDATQINLSETGPDTGVFVSKSNLLMGPDVPSDSFVDTNINCIFDTGDTLLNDANGDGLYDGNADDDYPVDDGTGVKVCDDTPGDRTHRAEVGGFVKAEYAPSVGGVLENSMGVCEGKIKILNVAVHIFLEPWEDTGYDPDGPGPKGVIGAGNKRFDWGPHGERPLNDVIPPHQKGVISEKFIDSSDNQFTYKRGDDDGGRRYGVIWEDNTPYDGVFQNVETAMSHARTLLSQACIRIHEVGPPNILDPDTHVNPTASTIDPDRLLMRQNGSKGKFRDFGANIPTSDEAIIQKYFRSSVNTDTDRDNDIIDIYFLAPLPSNTASQYSPVTVVEPIFTNGADPNNKHYIYQVHVGLGMISSKFLDTVGHELGHQLSNKDHPSIDPPDHIFFPSGQVVAESGLHWNIFRRLQHSMEITMRTDHGGSDHGTPQSANEMYSDGNHVLRDP